MTDVAYIYQLTKFGYLMSSDSKMHPVSCTNTHDLTDLLNHGIAKNTKT